MRRNSRKGGTAQGGFAKMRSWTRQAQQCIRARAQGFSIFVRPVVPQSEVLAKFLQATGEKCGENLAKTFAKFRPSIYRENGRKKFHEKSSTFSTVHKIKFFHCCNSGRWGAQIFDCRNNAF